MQIVGALSVADALLLRFKHRSRTPVTSRSWTLSRARLSVCLTVSYGLASTRACSGVVPASPDVESSPGDLSPGLLQGLLELHLNILTLFCSAAIRACRTDAEGLRVQRCLARHESVNRALNLRHIEVSPLVVAARQPSHSDLLFKLCKENDKWRPTSCAPPGPSRSHEDKAEEVPLQDPS